MEDNYMSFWRKYINGIFWTTLVLSELDVVWQAMNEWFGDRVAEGFAVLIDGTLDLILIFAIFGIGIDLCNNIADIRDKIYKSTTTQADHYVRSSQNTVSTLSKLQAMNDNGVLEDFWFCKECGAKNNRLSSYCKECGKFK